MEVRVVVARRELSELLSSSPRRDGDVPETRGEDGAGAEGTGFGDGEVKEVWTRSPVDFEGVGEGGDVRVGGGVAVKRSSQHEKRMKRRTRRQQKREKRQRHSRVCRDRRDIVDQLPQYSEHKRIASCSCDDVQYLPLLPTRPLEQLRDRLLLDVRSCEAGSSDFRGDGVQYGVEEGGEGGGRVGGEGKKGEEDSKEDGGKDGLVAGFGEAEVVRDDCENGRQL